MSYGVRRQTARRSGHDWRCERVERTSPWKGRRERNRYRTAGGCDIPPVCPACSPFRARLRESLILFDPSVSRPSTNGMAHPRVQYRSCAGLVPGRRLRARGHRRSAFFRMVQVAEMEPASATALSTQDTASGLQFRHPGSCTCAPVAVRIAHAMPCHSMYMHNNNNMHMPHAHAHVHVSCNML